MRFLALGSWPRAELLFGVQGQCSDASPGVRFQLLSDRKGHGNSTSDTRVSMIAGRLCPRAWAARTEGPGRGPPSDRGEAALGCCLPVSPGDAATAAAAGHTWAGAGSGPGPRLPTRSPQVPSEAELEGRSSRRKGRVPSLTLTVAPAVACGAGCKDSDKKSPNTELYLEAGGCCLELGKPQ